MEGNVREGRGKRCTGETGEHGTLLFLLGWLLHTHPHGHICHVALKSCHIPGSGAKEGHGTRGKTAGQRSEVREGIQVKRKQPVTGGVGYVREVSKRLLELAGVLPPSHNPDSGARSELGNTRG